jgi:hypothetical protein
MCGFVSLTEVTNVIIAEHVDIDEISLSEVVISILQQEVLD